MKRIATKPQKRSWLFKARIKGCWKVRRAAARNSVIVAGSVVSSFVLLVGLAAIFFLIMVLLGLDQAFITSRFGQYFPQVWLSTPFPVGFYISTKYKSAPVKRWVNFLLTFYFLWIVALILVVMSASIDRSSYPGGRHFETGIKPLVPIAAAALFLLLTILRDLPKKILEPSKKQLETKDFLTLENNLRTMILQMVGGLVVILGLYFAWQNAGIADENQRISLEQNRQERFDRFVEMSKDLNNVEQRVMGIAGMLRIADTPGSSDLQGDVRLFVEGYLKKWADSRIARNIEASQPLQPLPDDIKFIFQNYVRNGDYEDRGYLRLRGLDFSKLDLEDVQMMRADMRDANFTGANCSLATFYDMNMRGTRFVGTNLTRAFFENTQLGDADFTGADIEGANFEGVGGLTAEQIRKAVNFEKAHVTPALRAELGLP